MTKAKHYNYEHLELRVEWDHGHGVELESTPQQLQEARHRLADSGIELSCIATGVRFIDPDPQKRAEQVELLKRYIDLSETVGAKNIRIFGDRVPDTPVEVSQTLDWEAEGIRACDGHRWRCRGCTLFGDTRQSYRQLGRRNLTPSSGTEYFCELARGASRSPWGTYRCCLCTSAG